MAMKEQVDAMVQALRSDKITARKDGYKQLTSLLDSPAFTAYIDAETARHRPQDKLTIRTWPGLVDVYLQYVDKERESASKSKKQGLATSDIGKGLRRLVTAADNEGRSGHRHQLQRKAAKLIRHVSSMLCVDGMLGTHLGGDYLAVLRHQLLTPEYLQLAQGDSIMDVLDVVLERLGALRNHSPDAVPAEADGLLGTVAAAIGAVTPTTSSISGGLGGPGGGGSGPGAPGGLNRMESHKLASCMAATMSWMFNAGEQGRCSQLALSCLNHWLLDHGLDHQALLSALHQQVYPQIHRTWLQPRYTKLKESSVLYLLIMLQLDIFQEQISSRHADDAGHLLHADGDTARGHGSSESEAASLPVALPSSSIAASSAAFSIHSLHELVAKEVESEAFKWDPHESRPNERRLNTLYLQLLAELEYYKLLSPSRPGAAAGDDALVLTAGGPSKRPRMQPSPSDEPVLDRVAARPERWMPVLAALILRRGRDLAPEFLLAALLRLSAVLQDLISKGQHIRSRQPPPPLHPSIPSLIHKPAPASAPGAKECTSLIWALRATSELAATWPLAQLSASLGAEAGRQWREVGGGLLRQLLADSRAMLAPGVAREMVAVVAAVMRHAVPDLLTPQQAERLMDALAALVGAPAPTQGLPSLEGLPSAEGPALPLAAGGAEVLAPLLQLLMEAAGGANGRLGPALDTAGDTGGTSVSGQPISPSEQPSQQQAEQQPGMWCVPARMRLLEACLDAAPALGLPSAVAVTAASGSSPADLLLALARCTLTLLGLPLAPATPMSPPLISTGPIAQLSSVACCPSVSAADPSSGHLPDTLPSGMPPPLSSAYAHPSFGALLLLSAHTPPSPSLSPAPCRLPVVPRWPAWCARDDETLGLNARLAALCHGPELLRSQVRDQLQHQRQQQQQQQCASNQSAAAPGAVSVVSALGGQFLEALHPRLAHLLQVMTCEDFGSSSLMALLGLASVAAAAVAAVVAAEGGAEVGASHADGEADRRRRSVQAAAAAVLGNFGRVVMVTTQYIMSLVGSLGLGTQGAAKAAELMLAIPHLDAICSHLAPLITALSAAQAAGADGRGAGGAGTPGGEGAVVAPAAGRVSATDVLEAVEGALALVKTEVNRTVEQKKAAEQAALQPIIRAPMLATQAQPNLDDDLDMGAPSRPPLPAGRPPRSATAAAGAGAGAGAATQGGAGAGPSQWQGRGAGSGDAFGLQADAGVAAAVVGLGAGGGLGVDVAAAPMYICVLLLQALSLLHPLAACDTATSVHARLTAEDTPYSIPFEVQEGLVYCLAHCVYRQYRQVAPQHLRTLLRWLQPNTRGGLMAAKHAHTDARLGFALGVVRMVLAAGATAAAAGPVPAAGDGGGGEERGMDLDDGAAGSEAQRRAAALRQAAEAAVPVLLFVSERMKDGASARQGEAGLGLGHCPWLRVLLGAAVADVLWMDAKAMVEHRLADLDEDLSRLLADEDFQARRAGSQLAPAVLLAKFPEGHTDIFQDIFHPTLELVNTLNRDAAGQGGSVFEVPSSGGAVQGVQQLPPERVATSLGLLVEVAAASGALEHDCLLLMLCHAAQAPSARQRLLALWALELLAARMGYGGRAGGGGEASGGGGCGDDGAVVPGCRAAGASGRAALLSFHLPVIAYHWLKGGNLLATLSSLHEAFQGDGLPGSEPAGAGALRDPEERPRPPPAPSTPGSFLRAHAAVLTAVMLPYVEATHDLQALTVLAQETGLPDAKTLIKTHFNTVFAFSWPFIAKNQLENARVVAGGWVMKSLGLDAGALVGGDVWGITAAILCMAQDSTHIQHDAQPQQQQQLQQQAGALPSAGGGQPQGAGLTLAYRTIQDSPEDTGMALDGAPPATSVGGAEASSSGLGLNHPANPPFFSGECVIKALRSLPTPNMVEMPWGMISKSEMLPLLLHLHCHLAAACHPRHRLQRLPAACAALELMAAAGAAAVGSGAGGVASPLAEPAACRYTVHLLLQLLHHRELVPVTCLLVGRLLDVLLPLHARSQEHAAQQQRAASGAGAGTTQGEEKKAQGGGRRASAAKAAAAAAAASAAATATAASAAAAAAAPDALECVIQPLVLGLVGAMEASNAWATQGGWSVWGDAASAGGPSAAEVRAQLAALVLRLTVKAPPELHRWLRDVGPLSPLPELQPALALQQRLQRDLTLPEQLQQLADAAEAAHGRKGGPQAVTRAAAALMEQLPARASELLAGAPPPTSPAGSTLSLPAGVEVSAWRLAACAAALGDADLAGLAGTLLAGPKAWFLATSLPLPLRSSPEPSAPASPTTLPIRRTSTTTGASPAGGQPSSSGASTPLSRLLPLLCACLVDPNPDAVEAVLHTLRLLLGGDMPEGPAALELLPPTSVHRVYLQAFLPEHRPQQEDKTQTAREKEADRQLLSPTPADLTSPALWRAPLEASPEASGQLLGGFRAAARQQGVAYEQWVRRLSSALLSNCSDPVMRLMHRVSALKTPLAEALFPEAVLSLATSPEVAEARPELRGLMAAELSRNVLQGNGAAAAGSGSGPGVAAVGGKVDARAVGLVLRCLEGLRRVHRDYVKSGRARAPVQSAQAKGKGKGERVQSGAAPTQVVGGEGAVKAEEAGGAGGGGGVASKGRKRGRNSDSGQQQQRQQQQQQADEDAFGFVGDDGGATGLEPDLWPTVYCLDIDYLVAAAAAVRCHAPLTALSFIEHWFEAHSGDGTLLHGLLRLTGEPGGGPWGPAPPGGWPLASVDAATKARVEALLLDVYGSVGEPDSVYALAQCAGSLGMAQMVRLYEHEGNWQAAVQCHDLALRAGSGWGGGGGGGAGGGGGDAASVQSMAHCLMRMGSSHAALAYLRQQQSQQQQWQGRSQQATTDLLYEVSWRLGLWEVDPEAEAAAAGANGVQGIRPGVGAGRYGSFSGTASEASPGSGSAGVLFNRSVHAALRALSLGDRVTFLSALRSATAGCLGTLVAGAGGGAAGSGLGGCGREASGGNGGLGAAWSEDSVASEPVVVRCRMVGLLREAGKMRWAAAAGAREPSGAAASSSSTPRGLPGTSASLLLQGVSAPGDTISRGEYELLEPLIALRSSALQAIGRRDLLSVALVDSATAARKAGNTTQGMADLQQLKGLRDACSQGLGQAGTGSSGGSAAEPAPWCQALLRPDARWRLEESRLLWLHGQPQLALQSIRQQVAEMQALYQQARAKAKQQQQQQQQQQALGSAVDVAQLAAATSLAGKWMAEVQLTGSQGAKDVLSMLRQGASYLPLSPGTSSSPPRASPPSTSSSPAESARLSCRLMYRLASFADQQYRAVRQQKTMPEFFKQRQVVESKRQQILALRAKLNEHNRQTVDKANETQRAKDVRRWLEATIMKLQRPVDLDEAHRSALDKREVDCRATMLEAYRRCLLAGQQYDLQVVYRLCQLWFELRHEPAVNDALSRTLTEVPSYKFVPLVYQMASRVGQAKRDSSNGGAAGSSDNGAQFQAVLQRALLTLATQHPHHTLHHLIALRNGDYNPSGRPATAADAANQFMHHVADKDKLAAAKAILEAAKAVSGQARVLVQQYEEVVQAYVELAAMPAPDERSVSMQFPARVRRTLEAARLVPVVSVNLPVDPGGSYPPESLPMVVQIGPTISFVGGINKPKLVQLHDSFGQVRKQLVKSGNDDMRQDDVIRQFFSLMNRLMQHSRATAERGLGLRTYKVVPFSPCAGLLEWVSNTMCLTEYLVGPGKTGGAHARYAAPGDWDYPTTLKAMFAVANQPAKQLDTFRAVCARFRPVLHHFFLEAFASPSEWFRSRLAYTRSVATSSMAGYVIGLGDRHLSNMLVDKLTAEVIHIDFGVAFEQGLFLNSPELVPFRLTRDVVDGMGVAGTEGVMRRCCEECMQVLRDNRDSILTVVGVVIADPLYRWAMTPFKARQRQHDPVLDSEGGDGNVGADDGQGEGVSGSVGQLGNADAERAVLRVKQKLEGVEGGEGGPRSVMGQVSQLMDEAQDSEKLCRMYPGWGAWM